MVPDVALLPAVIIDCPIISFIQIVDDAVMVPVVIMFPDVVMFPDEPSNVIV